MKRVFIGVMVGVLLLAVARFAFNPPERPTYYHANFAAFVDGRRLDFSGSQYMEGLGMCKVGEAVLPTERVHLHNQNPNVVHVHHEDATRDEDHALRVHPRPLMFVVRRYGCGLRLASR